MTNEMHRLAATLAWFFACGVLAVPPEASAADVVRSVENPETGHRYCLIRGDDPRAGISWRDAQRKAAALGGQLVTINSEQERQWLIEKFPADAETMLDYHLWIGLNDAELEGTFTWESGDASDFSAWYGDEPNDAGRGEDYVQIYNFAAGQFAWNDMPEGPLASISGGEYPVSAIAEVAAKAGDARVARAVGAADDAPARGSASLAPRAGGLADAALAEQSFPGVYRGGGGGRPIFVVKEAEGRYEISTPNWIGSGYWDPLKRQYEGVFQYRENPLGHEEMFKPGGSGHKMVGYHRIEPLSRGKYLVAWKTDLVGGGEEGAYVIERAPEP